MPLINRKILLYNLSTGIFHVHIHITCKTGCLTFKTLVLLTLLSHILVYRTLVTLETFSAFSSLFHCLLQFHISCEKRGAIAAQQVNYS